jgi:membrane protease YdiL (CAAX protease family)
MDLALFFLLAFGLTWTLHLAIPVLGLAFTSEPASPGQIAYVAGIAGPSLAALAVTAAREGRRGLRALLAPALRVRFPLRYWALALLGVGAIRLAGIAIHVARGGAPPEGWTRVGADALPLLVAQQVYVMAGEEIGWRAFALPRLAARLGALRAALLLGVLWAAWHLPMFLVPGSSQHGTSFAGYLVLVVAWSLVMAVLWVGTGSVLAPMLFHGALNLWSAALAVPAGAVPAVRAVYAAVALLAAAWLARAGARGRAAAT